MYYIYVYLGERENSREDRGRKERREREGGLVHTHHIYTCIRMTSSIERERR